MGRKLLLILTLIVMLIATLRLSTPTHAADPEPKTPTQWGTNYYQEFWSEEATAALTKLPLSFVRWGGNQSDSGSTSDINAAVFAAIMHKQNIEPIFQISLFHTDPEHAASIVKFVNVEKKAGLKYWSIGNEPNYFKAVQHNDISLEDYLKKWRELATAMKAADPSILLVGPDDSIQMSPLDKASNAWQWFDAFVKANGDLTDVIAFHFYPFYEKSTPSREDIMNSADQYAEALTDMRAYLHQTLKRELPVMLTEVNLNSNPGVGGDVGSQSLMAGLWFAEICGISAQQGLASVQIWTAVGNQNLSLLGTNNTPRPTYYAMQAFAGYGLPIVDAQSAVDGVKAYASTTDKGIIMVLTNRTDKTLSVNLATDISLDSNHSLPSSSITLGAYSFTRLEFDEKGAFVAGTTYGETENSAESSAPSAIELDTSHR